MPNPHGIDTPRVQQAKDGSSDASVAFSSVSRRPRNVRDNGASLVALLVALEGSDAALRVLLAASLLFAGQTVRLVELFAQESEIILGKVGIQIVEIDLICETKVRSDGERHNANTYI